MRLHPVSLLAGAALFASILALSSAAPQMSLGSPGIISHDIAHPRNFVEIQEGSPYTVPTARLFVVTHVGGADRVSGDGKLLVDGVQICETYLAGETNSVGSIGRYVVQPGSTIEPIASNSQGRVWGFLTEL